MAEYKRFIAYFYEYINGKKQKNTGFAKVELRNGMWRILFRIRTDLLPDPPIQVYGFVREKGYLLGFPMGSMPNGCEIAEEWAYGAEKPIGYDTYLFSDLSGIWIQSGDGRNFITVWDDDPIDTKKFVLQIPKKELEIEKTEEMEDKEEGTVNAEETELEKKEESISEAGTEGESETEVEMETEEETEAEKEAEIEAEEVKTAKEEKAEKAEDPRIAELFQKRKSFRPFHDNEIQNCIQIMPCDIMMMQQNGWNVGRSSFLQHGFYQYHHLLFGKDLDGGYILGVPGVRNEQEAYMAQMFGFGQFKKARVCDCGKVFGYWIRSLKRA